MAKGKIKPTEASFSAFKSVSRQSSVYYSSVYFEKYISDGTEGLIHSNCVESQ